MVEGDPGTVEQVAKNLNKLIDVLKVVNVSDEDSVRRELALIRVKSDVRTRSEIMQIVDIFRANIVDVAPGTLIVEVIGDEDKVDALIDLLRSFGVQEVMRTGTVAMRRGSVRRAWPRRADATYENGERPVTGRSQTPIPRTEI